MKRTLLRSLQAFLMTIVLMLTMVVQPATAAIQVNYGESYHLENQWSDGKSYLDTCGLYDYCDSPNEESKVFTDQKPDRVEAGTGLWAIQSATGLENGTVVSIGDLVYLQNKWFSEGVKKGYLNVDACAASQSTVQLEVFTPFVTTPDYQAGTGTWKIESATGAENGTPVSTSDLIYLQNQWSGGKSYLDAFGDSHTYCTDTTKHKVATNPKADRIGQGTGTWKLIPTNIAPEVNGSIPDQVTTVSQNYIYTIPAETFTDPDGDELALSATLEDGSPLPTWLTFDPSTNTFFGTPAAGDIGTVTIKVSASDGIVIVTASTTFTLTVNDICRVSAVGESPAECVVTLPDDGTPVTVPVEIQTPAEATTLPLDLMLLQDLSSSFGNDLPVLRSLVPNLVSELRSLQPDTNFGLTAFVDKAISPFGNGGDYVYRTVLKLTADSDAFQNGVNSLIIKSGGDDPEASLEALLQVAVRAQSELGARQSARSAVIVSTDARYHKAGDGITAKLPISTPNNGDAILDGGGTGEDYPSVAQVKAAINNANLLPIFLVTSDVKPDYEGLVSQLGVGAVVELKADSSNLIDALKNALEIVNQNLTIVVLGDEFGYVTDVDPDQFNDIEPGSEVTTNVTFQYPGAGSDDELTIRAIGLGDLVIDVVVNLTDID
ncbi:MAG: hypothetical protein F6K37_29775 [Moorea sp. SIO4E2]|uniref:putative Ig domain-containing protein n=1 Tax=Moorena sp. SIO4E2 TaxID=2607826 RepID=UPI0013B5B503|nr:putative Ig domain-containing protein [Moorena sp. SIO4E2]NEQ09974.1 hypothetical protein [Moorena sp. SIO4E2]